MRWQAAILRDPPEQVPGWHTAAARRQSTRPECGWQAVLRCKVDMHTQESSISSMEQWPAVVASKHVRPNTTPQLEQQAGRVGRCLSAACALWWVVGEWSTMQSAALLDTPPPRPACCGALRVGRQAVGPKLLDHQGNWCLAPTVCLHLKLSPCGCKA